MSLFENLCRTNTQRQTLDQMHIAIQLGDPAKPFTARICKPLFAQDGVDSILVVLSPNDTTYCFPVGSDIGDVQARINAALVGGGHAPIDWSGVPREEVTAAQPVYSILVALEGGYSALSAYIGNHESTAEVQARVVEPNPACDPHATDIVVLIDLQLHVARLPCRLVDITLVLERVNTMLITGGFPPIEPAPLLAAAERLAQQRAQQVPAPKE